MYVLNPTKFITVTFKNLLEIRKWMDSVGQNNIVYNNSDIEYILNMGFCCSDGCQKKDIFSDKCEFTNNCLSEFKTQLLSSFKNVKNNKRKKKKKRRRYIPCPYPTFFCNKKMEKEVRNITNGNNIKQ